MFIHELCVSLNYHSNSKSVFFVWERTLTHFRGIGNVVLLEKYVCLLND